MIRILILGLIFSFVSQKSSAQDTISTDLNETTFFINEEVLDSEGVFTFWGIYFGLGTYELLDSSFKYYAHERHYELMVSNRIRLNAMANFMKQNPGYIVEIGVHTDCRGSKVRSIILSKRRAETICNELVKLGVDRERMIAKGFEDTVPYNDNGTLLTCDYIHSKETKQEQEILHAKNRRIEIVVVAKDYVPLEKSP